MASSPPQSRSLPSKHLEDEDASKSRRSPDSSMVDEMTHPKPLRKYTERGFYQVANGKSKHKEKLGRTNDSARSSPNYLDGNESNDTPPDVPERSPIRIPEHPPPPSRKTSAVDKVYLTLFIIIIISINI